jgi:DNA repair exonuclease SbcCD ATPase subunit
MENQKMEEINKIHLAQESEKKMNQMKVQFEKEKEEMKDRFNTQKQQEIQMISNQHDQEILLKNKEIQRMRKKIEKNEENFSTLQSQMKSISKEFSIFKNYIREILSKEKENLDSSNLELIEIFQDLNSQVDELEEEKMELEKDKGILESSLMDTINAYKRIKSNFNSK